MSGPWPGERSLSPIIGVLTLVVIVVAMAMLTGWMLLDFSSELGEPAPFFAKQGHVELTIDNGTIEEQEMVLVHRGGDPVHASNIEIQIDTGTRSITTTPKQRGDVADGTWSVNERLPIRLKTSDVCNGGDSLQVDIVYTGETSARIGSRRIPIARGGFTIENGAVVPVSDYTADATVLGSGFTYGENGIRLPIWLDVRIGNSSYEPWPGNVNNEGNPRSHTFTDLPAGAGIAVGATAGNGTHISERTRWSNETDGWVYVLRDGDTPPNIQGFGDQESAEDFVSPYLDESGNISLDENQAIYLFELGNSQTGSAADFQDVVVLVSLTTEAETGVKRLESHESVMVCPSE